MHERGTLPAEASASGTKKPAACGFLFLPILLRAL